MATWDEFEDAAAELAAFGEERLTGRVAYMATVGRHGTPRVHPVSPVFASGHLFMFMEPSSPKGRDLRRNGRYALHSSVSDSAGTGGEFLVRGRAALIEEPGLRAIAASSARSAGYSGADRYILFELFVGSALSTTYDDGRPLRRRWPTA